MNESSATTVAGRAILFHDEIYAPHSPAIRTNEMQQRTNNIESIRRSRDELEMNNRIIRIECFARERQILYRAARLHSTLHQRGVNLSLTRMSKQLSREFQICNRIKENYSSFHLANGSNFYLVLI